MLSRLLLLTVSLSLTLSAALAQSQPKPDHFPHYPASVLLRPGFALPAGPAPGALAAAPMPTVQAAALYAPLPRPAARPLPDNEPARHDLTGTQAAPPYDIYQGWSEAQRKYTLPAPYIEPLPLQLLRGVLAR